MRYAKFVDAVPFSIDMAEGYVVPFTGNFDSYEKTFKCKSDALDFIKNDDGKKEQLYDDGIGSDYNYELIYEDPSPLYKGKIIGEGDYIVTNGNKTEVIPKLKFESEYILHECKCHK